MADSTTPVYGFVQPEVGASTDTWGGKLNTDLTNIEDELRKLRSSHNTPSVGPTTTLDLSLARFFTVTVNQNLAFAFANIPSSSFAVTWRMRVTSLGAFTVTWPASVLWMSGFVLAGLPAGFTQFVEFYTTDGGTTVYAYPVAPYPAMTLAYPSADVNLPNNTVVVVPFNSEHIDVYNQHDNVTNNSRITVKGSGYYRVAFTGGIDFQSGVFSSDFSVKIDFKVNGTIVRTKYMTLSGDISAIFGYESIFADVMFFLNAGDYIEVQLYQVSGAQIGLRGGTANTWFEVTRHGGV